MWGKRFVEQMGFEPGVTVCGVIDGENAERDSNEVHVQDEVNQEKIEQNEVDGMKKGADSTGEVMNM